MVNLVLVSQFTNVYHGVEVWETYITHFELCAELGRWCMRNSLLTLAASLRGQARIFFMNLTTREKSSYREQRKASVRMVGSDSKKNGMNDSDIDLAKI